MILSERKRNEKQTYFPFIMKNEIICFFFILDLSRLMRNHIYVHYKPKYVKLNNIFKILKRMIKFDTYKIIPEMYIYIIIIGIYIIIII